VGIFLSPSLMIWNKEFEWLRIGLLEFWTKQIVLAIEGIAPMISDILKFANV